MFDLNTFLIGLLVLVITVLCAWGYSLVRRDVSIVDNLWSLMFVLVSAIYMFSLPQVGPRAELVLILVMLWAFRLSAYITWRN